MASEGTMQAPPNKDGEGQRQKQKERSIRESNIIAAKGVADAIRTSLGPRGMDKMIQGPTGEVVVTNDGATILAQMQVFHPTAKMLVELSKSQDIEAGDGTTTVSVIAGALLNTCTQLLSKGIHATAIADAFKAASLQCVAVLRGISQPVDFENRETLIHTINTCLSSKVVFQNADVLSPIAVDSVLQVIEPNATNVDLNDIRITKQIGGTVDDTELVNGLVFDKGCAKAAGGPTRIENAKIGLIQFCLSAPKTDMENNVVVSDYAAMDRILREERKYILQLCKKIKKAGCTVLLIQKSILRDATNELSLHFLAKMGIMTIVDVERKDIEFITRTINCKPVAHIDSFTADKLGSAELVHEVAMPGGTQKVVKCTGIENPGKTVSILMRGSNGMVLDEAERSLHDALCVMRALVKERYLIAGGGTAETECALRLTEWSREQVGMNAYCIKAFAEALEVVPYTLAENAGMNPIAMVTELRARHGGGESGAGINVRSSTISDMFEEHVLQPLLVSTSAIQLATECVCMILKIDDIVAVR